MEKKLPSSTKVVVIGGGVVGCSVAYHLAKFGWKDTRVILYKLVWPAMITRRYPKGL